MLVNTLYLRHVNSAKPNGMIIFQRKIDIFYASHKTYREFQYKHNCLPPKGVGADAHKRERLWHVIRICRIDRYSGEGVSPSRSIFEPEL